MDINEDSDVQRSGIAYYGPIRGYTEEVESCQHCAKALGIAWVPRLFEGVCRGCECLLSGFPINE